MIGAEGTKTRSKMQKPHFLLRCYPWELTQCPNGRKGQWETPQEQSDEEAPRPPVESEVPGAEIMENLSLTYID
ncbi:hypothetical protein AM500_17820 [Bacillus sp. FJAT-18017]|nr:hypothetical protein AM500_17820 [Bacillus sp. FJAT-18017]